MFVLTNTAGASATTPPASKTTLFVDASGVPSTKNNGGTVTPLLTGPAAALAYQPLDSDLTGIAGLTYAADKSIYYTGSAWATYDLTAAGRALSGVAGTANTFPYFSAANVVTLGSVGTTGLASLAAANAAAGRTAIGAAADSAVVHNTGDESGLAGMKSWTGRHLWTIGTVGSIGYETPAAVIGIVLRSGDTAGSAFTRMDIRATSTTLQLGAGASATTNAPTNFLNVTPNFIGPSSDNTMSGASASQRYTQLFAVNTTVSSSDARLKTEPRQLRDAEFRAASAIARLPAVWRWLNRVHGDENCEPEGREARKHFGPTVQAAIAVMEANGLDPFAYSFICYDEWEAEPEQWHEWEAEVDPETGEVTREAGRELIQPAREAGDRYSFRKEELLCFMVSALAAENDVQAAKIEAMDARLAALEART
ncbi:tail fiber domain-containing protein [Stenotrophomonas sp. GD03958]|uniref:tail fiber domain-containing protein n=1 Tax=Stenotrophomonas sp. GD03958 TaxID=2975411 RepID=UPI002447F3A9|nr:tail fiber domain-containing protein [Stenotrophomonas sp. GD03958]MDH1192547.1 tail fiber domain-containing protein [Stenotrophomonas sp. GD03958]